VNSRSGSDLHFPNSTGCSRWGKSGAPSRFYHGEWRVEAQILKQGELVIGRRFDTRALVHWANEERKAIESGDL